MRSIRFALWCGVLLFVLALPALAADPDHAGLQDRLLDEPAVTPACADLTDNDGDGLIDLADLGCTSFADDDESDEAFLIAEPVEIPVQVDGYLGEWAAADWVEIRAPEDYVQVLEPALDPGDVSARLAARWSPDTLYLAIRVQDDDHANNEAPAEYRAGDSVQIALDLQGNGGTSYDDSDDFELTACLATDAIRAVWTYAPGSEPLPPPAVGIVRNGDVTGYELAVPAADLRVSTWTAGRYLRATFVVNDNDGAGHAGWVEWTPGLGDAPSPDQFGWIQLAPSEAHPTPAPSPTPGNPAIGVTGCTCALGPSSPGPGGAFWLLISGLILALARRRRA